MIPHFHNFYSTFQILCTYIFRDRGQQVAVRSATLPRCRQHRPLRSSKGLSSHGSSRTSTRFVGGEQSVGLERPILNAQHTKRKVYRL